MRDVSPDREPVRKPAEPWTWLARIRRPQGRKGEVFADLLTDFPEKFTERRHLWLVAETPQPGRASASAQGALPLTREVELTSHWLHKGGIVLHFAGVDSISAAEELASLMVAVPRSERAPLPEGEAYIADLIGCTLVDVAPAAPVTVGEIEDVDRTAGPAPLLIVRGSRGEVLIPFAQRYLRKLDLDARRIEMELPEGLLELNL